MSKLQPVFRMTLLKYAAAAQIAKAGSLKTGKDAAAKAAMRDVRTIERWYREQPDFKRAVDEYMKQLAADTSALLFAHEISDRVERVRRLNDRWLQLGDLADGVVAAMLAAQDAEDWAEFRKHQASMAIIRDECKIAQQAAIELGQWQERTEMNFSTMTDEQLKMALRELGDDLTAHEDDADFDEE